MYNDNNNHTHHHNYRQVSYKIVYHRTALPCQGLFFTISAFQYAFFLSSSKISIFARINSANLLIIYFHKGDFCVCDNMRPVGVLLGCQGKWIQKAASNAHHNG